jgi:Flp pilus assembly protein TadD
MKRILLAFVLLLSMSTPSQLLAQPVKKTVTKEKAPASSDMDKAMEDAMKGMSEEEKAEMRKMMKDVMPEISKKPGSDFGSFTDNKTLVPAKDQLRINSISKKAFTDADISANAALLYSKLMAKIPADEKAIITGILAQAKNGSSLMSAAVVALMQGHYQASMGLAMKAVQADPKNVTNQSNLAAILSQSGYPENAIPLLKKLSAQFPGNSTVLNNLGYAWLCLGEIDTARRYFAYAAVRNPNNPETKLCRGLIEELKGDPKKAADNYVESFEELPNPFTENLAKNVNAQDRLEKIDFEKLKSRITIYEYFKKDWIKIPELSGSVSGYENDMRIKNGYEKMFEALTDTIDLMAKGSSIEMESLLAKGENEFVNTMKKESIKGLNMMSMPAVYIQKILQYYIKNWMEDYLRKGAAMMEDINAKEKIMTQSGPNDKCPDFDRKNNDFLSYANPLIRKFHADRIEEFRVWLNAFCTWSWYITGNPKNTILTACITWTSAIAGMYREAVNGQFAIAKSCVQQNGDGVASIAQPVIPNFTCPPVVSIPFGLDEIRLSAEAINFDDNSSNIHQSEKSHMPNVTLTFGMDRSTIAEAGKYGNPYMKTGNGSVNTSNIGTNDDDELTPLKKITDDLTPLSKIPPDELEPLDPRLLDTENELTPLDMKRIREAELARKVLHDMMSTKCPGELPKKNNKKEKFEVGKDEGKPSSNPKVETADENFHGTGLGKSTVDDIVTNGPQPVINNGPGMMNKATGFIKDLFK